MRAWISRAGGGGGGPRYLTGWCRRSGRDARGHDRARRGRVALVRLERDRDHGTRWRRRGARGERRRAVAVDGEATDRDRRLLADDHPRLVDLAAGRRREV